MLSCKDITRLATDYEERKLGLWQRIQMHLHLFICVHCRHFIHQFRLTRQVVKLHCEHPDHVVVAVDIEQQVAQLVKAAKLNQATDKTKSEK